MEIFFLQLPRAHKHEHPHILASFSVIPLQPLPPLQPSSLHLPLTLVSPTPPPPTTSIPHFTPNLPFPHGKYGRGSLAPAIAAQRRLIQPTTFHTTVPISLLVYGLLELPQKKLVDTSTLGNTPPLQKGTGEPSQVRHKKIQPSYFRQPIRNN